MINKCNLSFTWSFSCLSHLIYMHPNVLAMPPIHVLIIFRIQYLPGAHKKSLVIHLHACMILTLLLTIFK